jgi:hypothetical protein
METIDEQEAVTRFALTKLLPGYDSRVPIAPGGTVRVHEGDLSIEGDLRLDWGAGWGDEERGMVVTGDLGVSGSVLNTEGDSGPFLVVLGNLRAGNLVAGGSSIHIDGDVHLDEILVAFYNHGKLAVKGTVTARLVINDEHATDLGRYEGPAYDVRRAFQWGYLDPEWGSELAPLQELLVDEVTLWPETWFRDGTSYDAVDVAEDIVPRIAAGEAVLRASGAQRREKTYSDWLAAVQADARKLTLVPKKLRSPELCLAAVSGDGDLLDEVPKSSRTFEVCLAAVRRSGRVLSEVPRKLRTPELCRAAVEQNGRALESVPEPLRTAELCAVAVRGYGDAIALVPPELRTRELLLDAVRTCPAALQLVPKAWRDREMCRAALGTTGADEALPYIPRKLLDEGLATVAVRADSSALAELPISLRTRQVCRAAVEEDGTAIEHVPEKLRDEEMKLAAVRQTPAALTYLEPGEYTEELCVAAVSTSGGFLYSIPREWRTEAVCRAAVAASRSAFEYVPEELRERLAAELARA